MCRLYSAFVILVVVAETDVFVNDGHGWRSLRAPAPSPKYLPQTSSLPPDLAISGWGAGPDTGGTLPVVERDFVATVYH